MKIFTRWFGNSKASIEEIEEAQELLGDKVHNMISRSEIATLVKKVVKTTGCARRREKLNRFHERLLGK